MLKIPGIREFLNENGYATYFEKKKYMLSHSIIKSIYQGALGEVVGKFILEKKLLDILNHKFGRLPIANYEKFDNKIKDIYFDFKNWNGSYSPNLSSQISKIRRKMGLTNADKLVVVNILKSKMDVKPYNETVDGTILTLPYLFDEANNVYNYEGLKKLYEVLINV